MDTDTQKEIGACLGFNDTKKGSRKNQMSDVCEL